MEIRPQIRDLTKEPYWRENLRKDIEEVLYDKKKEVETKDLLAIIEKLYSLFVNEFHFFNVDHTEFRKAILELKNPGLPPIK